MSKSTAKATEEATEEATTRVARNATRHTHGKAGLVAGAVAGGLALMSINNTTAHADTRKDSGQGSHNNTSRSNILGTAPVINSKQNGNPKNGKSRSIFSKKGFNPLGTLPPRTLSNKQDKSKGKKNPLINSRKSSSHVGNVDKLNAKTKRKHKTLIKREWSLIRYLNDFWDIWLRHIKESGGGDSGKDAGDVSDDGDNKDKEYWRKKIKEVAKAEKVDISDDQVEKLLGTIEGESGYDEKAHGGNDGLSDGNAEGLLQFKPGTFNHYKAKGHGNIDSGVDQLYAFFNIANWAQYATGHAGWSPSGPTRGYEANGGVVTHATGGVFDQNINSQTSQLSPDLIAQADMRSVFYRSMAHRSNYIKSVKRNKATFKVSIDTSQAQIFNKQDIINRVINDEFSAWLTQKQQQKLLDYYSNETSSQFV